MKQLILATSSPHRKAAFEMLGIPFTAESSEVDEYFTGRPAKPDELVKALARLKAEAVAKNHKEGIIIGFDSVAYFEGEILEKPKSKHEARERLLALSGKQHFFYTGIYAKDIPSGKALKRVVKTDVQFRTITEQEIDRYLSQDTRFMTYATGYDPLGNYSSTFVKGIKGSYNNLTRGIPLEAIVEIIKELG